MSRTPPISVPISPGELIDKITILEIKRQRIGDVAKRDHVELELALLTTVRDKAIAPSDEVNRRSDELREVNSALWEIEEELRACERANDFSAEFVRLARSVYAYNDRRARLKRAINEVLRSTLIEEKSYVD